jgi:hypothetical protein
MGKAILARVTCLFYFGGVEVEEVWAGCNAMGCVLLAFGWVVRVVDMMSPK